MENVAERFHTDKTHLNINDVKPAHFEIMNYRQALIGEKKKHPFLLHIADYMRFTS